MAFEVDGFTPTEVIRPGSLVELASTLADLNASGTAVIPWGGGTRMHVGNLPTDYDAALDLSALPVEIEHVSGDMVCIASAGAMVASVQAELARSGQRLPFDVPRQETATIGGSLASNAAGRMRSSFGGLRDWLIGMKVMQPDGSMTKSGGRVVKNVQGFDLHRLHVGAYGSLGIIVEAGFKLVPLPPAQKTVAAWFDSLASAGDYAMGIFNGPFAPEAFVLVTGVAAEEASRSLTAESNQEPTSYLVLVKCAGVERAVERMISESTGAAGTSSAAGYAVLEDALAAQAWASLSDHTVGGALAVRTALRPTAALNLLANLERRNSELPSGGPSSLLDVGFGGLQIVVRSGDEAQIRAWAGAVFKSLDALGASYVAERMPTALKHHRDVFGNTGATIDIMRRLKREFDPNHTLNRGRFAGGI